MMTLTPPLCGGRIDRYIVWLWPGQVRVWDEQAQTTPRIVDVPARADGRSTDALVGGRLILDPTPGRRAIYVIGPDGWSYAVPLDLMAAHGWTRDPITYHRTRPVGALR